MPLLLAFTGLMRAGTPVVWTSNPWGTRRHRVPFHGFGVCCHVHEPGFLWWRGGISAPHREQRTILSFWFEETIWVCLHRGQTRLSPLMALMMEDMKKGFMMDLRFGVGGQRRQILQNHVTRVKRAMGWNPRIILRQFGPHGKSSEKLSCACGTWPTGCASDGAAGGISLECIS